VACDFQPEKGKKSNIMLLQVDQLGWDNHRMAYQHLV